MLGEHLLHLLQGAVAFLGEEFGVPHVDLASLRRRFR